MQFFLQSTPCKHPVIVLQDVAFTDLHALVEFIYHGEVNVHQRSLSSFLKTAEVLRVSGLTQQHAEQERDIAQQLQPQHNNTKSEQLSPLHHNSEDHIPSSPADSPTGAGSNASGTSSSAPPPTTQHNNRRFSASRRERRNSLDQPQHSPEPPTTTTPTTDSQPPISTQQQQKRPRQDVFNLNNNSPPEQLTPTDFSPSAMKAAALAALQHAHNNSDSQQHSIIGGNGLDSAPHSPSHHALLHHHRLRPMLNHDDDVKNEPMDATMDLDNNSMDSTGDNTHDGMVIKKSPPPLNCSAVDHDDHDFRIHPAFLANESKLFATAAGTFNFSMAALAGDHTGLAGKYHL